MDLATIKKHLNIDSSFTDDDTYLMFLEEVAQNTIERHIDKTFAEIEQEEGGEVPKCLLHAQLLYIGNLYNSRESITFASANEIPFTYDYLLSLYKDYSKKEDTGGLFG